MKNLFIINEDERSRILNLHETATKGQYLNEQFLNPPFTPNSITVSNSPVNTAPNSSAATPKPENFYNRLINSGSVVNCPSGQTFSVMQNKCVPTSSSVAKTKTTEQKKNWWLWC